MKLLHVQLCTCTVCFSIFFCYLNDDFSRFGSAELHLDPFLSDDFCQEHYLVGLLLQEVRMGLNVIKEVRKIAIRMLRNILAKHCFDKRYKGQVSF